MKQTAQVFLFCYRLSIRLKSKCFSLLSAGAFAHFGKRTVVMCPLRLVGEHRISVGDDVFIGPGSWLQALQEGADGSVAIVLGNGTSVAGACVISAVKQVILEDEVLVARNVYISDHVHRHTDTDIPIRRQGLDKIAPVRIKKGAWLGENVVICPGVTVGRGAVVGANSVVTRDIPDFAVAVGSPARVVKTYTSPKCSGTLSNTPEIETQSLK